MAVGAIIAAALLASSWPLYKQCDERWGDDMMGVPGPGSRRSVCREGCAMSCVAMALSGNSFVIPGTGAAINPGTLNAYLVATHGYECIRGDCDNLVLNAPDALSGGRMRYIGEWPAAREG